MVKTIEKLGFDHFTIKYLLKDSKGEPQKNQTLTRFSE